MLFAVSVKVTLRKNQRRLDLIVETDDPQEVSAKAIKQARKLYNPGKKAVYTVLQSVSETEALEVLPTGNTQNLNPAFTSQESSAES
ncbi:MAG TPA: hypothetical protein VEC37_02350 [Bacillota bacterium]|nr:hypothetical protein [Bacillota bacterium]